MQPRGIRNNNPGNIRISKDKWQGLADNQSDDEFFVFKSAPYGIRALARVLITYYDKYGLETIDDIITRWAPPSENDTEGYIVSVAEKTKASRFYPNHLHCYEDIEPLVKAIIYHENGQQPYSQAVIDKGLVLAGIEPPARKDNLSDSRTIQGAKLAGGATVTAAVAETVNQFSPAYPLLGKIAEYAPFAMLVIVLSAIAYIVYARIDDKKRGLR